MCGRDLFCRWVAALSFCGLECAPKCLTQLGLRRRVISQEFETPANRRAGRFMTGKNKAKQL